MKIIHLTYPLPSDFVPEASSMAIGYFDGVHCGHQGVIGDAVRSAQEWGIKSSVMTFDPHPKYLFGNSAYAEYITPLDKKLQIFDSLGVDIAYIVSFTMHFSQMSAEEFVSDFLVLLRVRSVTVGFDFSFGRRASAYPHDLQQLANGRFSVKVVSSINSKYEKISSTHIRKELQKGNIQKVNHYLGRRYSIWGHWDSHLQTFMLTSPSILPAKGSYRVSIKSDDQMVKCILEITDSLTLHDLPHLFGNSDCLEIQFLDYLHSEPRIHRISQFS